VDKISNIYFKNFFLIKDQKIYGFFKTKPYTCYVIL